MTRIKLCGLSRPADIKIVNSLCPEYIGFVFYEKSSRYITPEKAGELKNLLSDRIKAVGVFVDEPLEKVVDLLDLGIIDIAQLHGNENDEYIKRLRELSKSPVIKAFRIKSKEDIKKAEGSLADFILLDSGQGSGEAFDWELLRDIKRDYFLAGGLDPYNVKDALRILHPYAVDVSSGIEKDHIKDESLMAAFVSAVRKEEGL
ncbi:MAG: phosphoribosylanthranilate isomerase [Lachnospiraceae bacterium]|nr:phosphoribosylanthranilate isomerase [Lachnospiraceae bacterium]